MKMMKKSMVTAAASLLVATTMMAGETRTQAADGVARSETRVQRAAERQLIVPVEIDLSRVSARGSNVALGGYVAKIEFDRERVELVDVQGGRSKAYSSAPISTEKAQANQRGVVKMTAYNTDDTTATGKLNVANVTFRELVRGGAGTIRVSIESASSMLVKDASGAIQQFAIRVAE